MPLGAVGETPVKPAKTGSRCEEVVKSVQTLMMGQGSGGAGYSVPITVDENLIRCKYHVPSSLSLDSTVGCTCCTLRLVIALLSITEMDTKSEEKPSG